MNGKTAKNVRKEIYGTDFSPRARKYGKFPNGMVASVEQGADGKIVPTLRLKYQRAKVQHNATPRG